MRFPPRTLPINGVSPFVVPFVVLRIGFRPIGYLQSHLFIE